MTSYFNSNQDVETPELTVEVKTLEEIRKAKQIKSSETVENQDSHETISKSLSFGTSGHNSRSFIIIMKEHNEYEVIDKQLFSFFFSKLKSIRAQK